MELKRAKVIMLPTEDITNIILDKRKSYLKNNNDIYYRDHDDFIKEATFPEGISYQHLYFTTDEEIKEGWCIIDKECVYFNGEYGEEVKRSKIISTTDTKLKGVAQPSKAFIEKYCKEGGIDEVDVEYISTWSNPCKKECLETKGLRGTVHEGISVCDDGCVQSRPELRLKIDSHNTITIHPIKNSWSREEVENLLYDALTTDGRGAFNVAWESEDADKYIKDNL